ncbi:MAG: lipocalin-like domain-containing protein [Anaerolineae bacterium]|jgi:predicted secreted hydrolase
MKRWFKALIGIGLFALLLAVPFLILQREEPQVQARLVALADDTLDDGTAGYLRVFEPRDLVFPTDHGPHLDYQTEWWYYTGNLVAEGGQRFGYQLTFFRRALAPPAVRAERESAWAADQVYMAHFALTDISGERFQATERFARGAAGLAGAQAGPYHVWLEDWAVEELEPGVTRMRARTASQDPEQSQEGLALDLVLVDGKGPVLQGDRGYSPKGPQPGNASYYYSLTRLETSGTVQVGETVYPVSGQSWMDHEWSTSALAADQVGWDWFSIQMDDGSELMVFQLRKEDGSIDPFSSGTLVAPDGSTRHLGWDEFEIRVEDTWRSPHTGATYPARWMVTVLGEELVLRIEPYLADQELTLSYTYWEGAVRVEGERAGQAVSGNGYVEMTGYAGSMQGQF